MGVYIPNIKMPESCFDCAYSIEEDGICEITEGGCDWGHERPPHCPLIEIDEEVIKSITSLEAVRKAMEKGGA